MRYSEGLDVGGTECDLGCLGGSTLSVQLLETILHSAHTEACDPDTVIAVHKYMTRNL